MDVTEACKRIHEMLESLPKWHEPSNNLPKNGIYFFYEEGETTPHTRKQRIVRVGTHGARRTLKQRLKNDHYNGNSEGSIFRKHLGTALLKRACAPETQIKEWRKRRKNSVHWKEFEGIEQDVDEVLRSRFFFRVICVDSVEERKVFEEKIIATISACPVCSPSGKWLGNFAWSEKVRRSGLWNSNFVGSSARLTEKDLKRLKQLACENPYDDILTSCQAAQKLNIGNNNRLTRMYANKEVEKEKKKVRIFDELLLIGGRNKLIFKAPDDEKHYTLRVSKEGILDVHETIEGKEKFDEKYPIEGRKKFDLTEIPEIILLVAEVTESKQDRQIKSQISRLRDSNRISYALQRLGIIETEDIHKLIEGETIEYLKGVRSHLLRILFVLNDEIATRYQKENSDIIFISQSYALSFIEERAKLEIKQSARVLLPRWLHFFVDKLLQRQR